jgi:hypothetical protein
MGLSWQREGGTDLEQLASLLEQEGELRSTRVTAVVDRSPNPGKRSLAWDVLPVGIRGGLLHAKVVLLAWEHMVRIMIGSANLTIAGYREQVETAVVLEIVPGSKVPGPLVTQSLDAVRDLIARAQGSATQPGPKQRALESLDIINRQVRASALPERPGRRAPRFAVTMSSPGQPAYRALDEVWVHRGRPRTATVLSPFFDEEPGKNSASAALADRMARTGHARLRFVLPTDLRQAATLVRAPESLAADIPARLGPDFYRLATDGPEPRRLHAKVIVLESDDWVAALIGSSNFTRAGLGLNAASGHLEINFAIGCAATSALGRQLTRLIPIGEPLSAGANEWEQEQDEDELMGPELPWGFAEALLLTGKTPALRLTLDAALLPETWRVTGASGELLTDSSRWRSDGCPRHTTLNLASDELPAFLDVAWEGDGVTERAGWPVNADQPSALPLPQELSTLRLMDLVFALQSSRPLPEALARAVANREEGGGDIELDPLVRFSGTGRLLQRTRMISGALAGLHPFLERPAPTLDALRWRLNGPVGPAALAKGFHESAAEPNRLPGEAAFMLAELALTLKRIDWEIVGSAGLARSTIQREVAQLRRDIREKIAALEPQGPLADYIGAAMGARR